MAWLIVVICIGVIIWLAAKAKQNETKVKQALKLQQQLRETEGRLQQLSDYIEMMDYNVSAQKELQESLEIIKKELQDKRVERTALDCKMREIRGQIDTEKENLVLVAQQHNVAAQSLNDCLAQLNSWQQTSKEALNRVRLASYGNGITLGLTEREIFEIKKLQEVTALLINPLVINKAIYEVYLRDKIKRLVDLTGVAGKTGIYRIYVDDPSFRQDDGAPAIGLASSVKNDAPASVMRCYVGKSVDIGNRWATHLKRLIGADEATREVFYKEGKQFIGELKWEMLEECSKEELGEKERYWIDFYGDGWNMR